jgi:hypothetical protein
MKKIISLFYALMCLMSIQAQYNLEINSDPAEIRMDKVQPVDLTVQANLRQGAAWQAYLANHSGWHVHFNEKWGTPHRAYGPGISFTGNIQDFAMDLIHQFIGNASISLNWKPVTKGDKLTWYRASQHVFGSEVLQTEIVIVCQGDKIVMWGLDLVKEPATDVTAAFSDEVLRLKCLSGIEGEIENAWVEEGGYWMLTPGESKFNWSKMKRVWVYARNEIGIPKHYLCFIDVVTGEIKMRVNQVRHVDPPRKAEASMLLNMDVQVNGTYYLTSPWDATVNGSFPNMQITVNGSDYFTDLGGFVSIPVTGTAQATLLLQGPWAKVNTGNITPSMTTTIVEGSNVLNFDGSANVKERTAYRSVQDIHDHMKYWMPTFTGMDFQLPTNIDVTGGDCNAFYDGTSINFYDLANGCNASSTIPDVAYHEYGHGINDNFYQSLGGNFMNGAMGEAYADFWAISTTNNPILGSGFYIDNQDPIRRYDQDPQVYPMDLVGEVHQDGMIIMGAWWDTHLLLGSDWNITMPLFIEAYSGMQAQAFDGNEGTAYTDVLIDVLLSDDDDADITNGTPNGNAIVQGFYMHGITLITNATLDHSPLAFADAGNGIDIQANLNLGFPYLSYLQEVKLHYKINNESWQEEVMTEQASNDYIGYIPGQSLATVVSYYITASDINGSVGAAEPFGAHTSVYPNLPYFVLVGVMEKGLQDCDNNEYWGAWTQGLPTDNASTGQWSLEVPVGSFTTDVAAGTEVQTSTQTTAGGEYCFVTGNALVGDGIGVNDVDAGKTTLQSPTIDMSAAVHPIVAYNRWYTNSPPGGANPGQDWFQVLISNDNGQNWTFIENTSTSDMRWRRNAFRVEDVIQPTAQMKFRFIASDSTHLGQNLDGGSLVEAALDDFILYDELHIGISEHDSYALQCYPNPAKGLLTLVYGFKATYVTVMDVCGRIVVQSNLKGYSSELDCSQWGSGVYIIDVQGEGVHRVQRVTVD